MSGRKEEFVTDLVVTRNYYSVNDSYKCMRRYKICATPVIMALEFTEDTL